MVAHVLLDLNRLDAATEVLERTMARPGDAVEPEAEAELWNAMARAHMRSARTPEAIEAAERALTLAEPRNMLQTIADAMNNRAAALNNIGRRREAIALLEAAVRIAAEGGWTTLEFRLRNNLAVSLYEDDPVRADQLVRDMVELAQRVGHTQWYLQSVANAAESDVVAMRRLPESLAMCEDAAARDVIGSQSWVQIVGEAIRIRSLLGLPFEDLVRQAEETKPTSSARWFLDTNAGEALVFQGRADEAVPLLRRALDSGFSESNEGYLEGMLALALLDAGDFDGAEKIVDRGRSGVFQGRLTQALRGAAEAGLAAAAGRTSEARSGFTESISALRDVNQLLEAIRCELVALRLLPDAPEAAAWAEEVRALSEAAGATSLLERLNAVRATSAAPALPSAPASAGAISDAT
jgi:tetratricopeptide (TPR) repeat protein